MRNIITLLLFLVVTSSHSSVYYKDTGWKLEPDGNGVYSVLPDNGRGGAVTNGCTTTACTRGGSLGGPLGKPRPTMTPTSTFPKGNIGAAALGLGSRILPWLAVGNGLYEWYNAAKVRPTENGFEEEISDQISGPGSGAWRHPSFGPPNGLGHGDPIEACRYAATQMGVNNPICSSPSFNGNSSAHTVWYPSGSLYGYLTVFKEAPCPFGAADSSGVCPYNRTWQPITYPQAQQRLSDAPITADQLRRAFDEILEAGGGIASTGTQVTGPSSAPGETTTKTTTAANGTTQVSTTTTNYNYTYNDNRVTVTETKTTQNPDGSTETETTDQPKDECARNPEALKCKELGQETGSPTWETKTVLFQAENLGLSGSCPAPWVANLRGWNLTMSYQPVCDVAPTVRLGLLAVTALMCIFVVIRVTQS